MPALSLQLIERMKLKIASHAVLNNAAGRSSSSCPSPNPSFRQTLLQVANPVSDIRETLLLIADLPLDAQRTAVAGLLQRLHKGADVYLTLPQRHFGAPLAGGRRPVRILHMDTADIGTQDLNRPQGIPFVVEEHVGWIKVYFQVGTFQLIQRPAQ